MNQIIKENIDKIEELCSKHDVQSLFVFGSVCSKYFSETSDIDLLISFKPMTSDKYAENYFFLADEFEAIFQRPVDLVTDKSLANPFFIESVNKSKFLIYEDRN